MQALRATYLSVAKSFASVQLRSLYTTERMASESEGRPSIHSSHIAQVHEVPIGFIKRPIPPLLDEAKVHSLMQTYKVVKKWTLKLDIETCTNQTCFYH